ncbi:MAG: twin-arginine translocation signal domain-containing protein, partial [Burkholderiales bacterium]
MSKNAGNPAQPSPSRRKFLKGAAVGTAAAASMPMFAMAAEKAAEKAAPKAPAVVSSTGAQSMRWQSTWPAKDIFHEYALDFAKKVNDMTGGELRIEVLPAGAVVPAFGLLDAVSKGALDGGHGVLVYHYGKQ